MLYANDNQNQKIGATPKSIGNCPFCNETLIPKCGMIKTWHWSHTPNYTCDSWYEPETQWHLDWKTQFQQKYTEVVIVKQSEKHIADYYNSRRNITIEFQNSPLSFADKIKRESFYSNLKWVIHVNGEHIEWLGFPKNKPQIYDSQYDLWTPLLNFRWKHSKAWVYTSPHPYCEYYLNTDCYIPNTHWVMIKIIEFIRWKDRTYFNGIIRTPREFIKSNGG